jgi:hypothetical protein
MTPARGEAALAILRDRNGQLTIVELASGLRCEVMNTAWGRDMGDDFDHVTTNISPGQASLLVDFFFMNEVARIRDGATGAVLFEV